MRLFSFFHNIGLTVSIVAFLLFSGCSHDQPSPRHYTIAIINPSSGLNEVVEGFKLGMTERGYIEGETITYLYAGPAGDDPDTITAQIDEALRKKVDLIYSLSTPVSKKVAAAISGTDTPGVFGPVFSPVDAGLAKSLQNPGGRMTGVMVRGSTGKALEWLLDVVPDVKSIFIPFHVTDKAACLTVEDLRVAADEAGITLITAELSTQEELDTILENIPEDADVVWRTCSHLLQSNTEKLVAAASARGIPVASSTHTRQDAGILVSYGENDSRLGMQVSRLADRLLQGARPESMPIETADFFLGVNLRKARELGIPLSDDILLQADYIVR